MKAALCFLIRRSEVRVLLGAIFREHTSGVTTLDVTGRQWGCEQLVEEVTP